MSEIQNAIEVSPLDEQMEQSLVKHNVTDAVIANLKDKYGALKLRTLDDKETYLIIKTAVKEVSKVRNAVVKVCKEGREDAVRIQKKWIAKEKEVLAKVAEVETPLDDQIAAFDNEAKRKEQEEKQRQEALYMQRVQALTNMGALYHDASFTLGEFTLGANLVKESSQNVWDDEIHPRFMEEHLKIKAEQVEQERKEAEYKAELKRQQEEMLRQQAEFKKKQEAFEQQRRQAEQEREKIRTDLQQKRSHLLFPYSHVRTGRAVEWDSLWTLSEDDFQSILEERKVLDAELQAQRTKQIEEAAALRERQRIAEEQKQAEIRKQQEELKRQEELAKAGDKELWALFMEQIKAITVPHFKSGQYRKVANISKEKLDEILALKPY